MNKQGKDTEEADVELIREAVRGQKDCSVCLLNYTKEGHKFRNQVEAYLCYECNDSFYAALFLLCCSSS